MFKTLNVARQKLLRDRQLPWRVLASKTVSYAWNLAASPLRLHGVTELGRGVRAVGAPRIENFGFMRIGDSTVIRSVNVPVELCTEAGARLVIGSNTSINYGTSIGTTGSIEIGDRVRVGPYCMIVDTDFHDAYNRAVRPPPRPVIIEDDVWIGAKACIMPGVRVGRGAIVGTAAVVTKDVPPFAVVGGVPAKVLKMLDPERFVPQEMY